MYIKRLSGQKTLCVCNAVNTGKYRPLDGSDWIDYWEQATGLDKESVMCQYPGCGNTEVVGTHVISLNEIIPRVFIAPLCEVCNGKKKNLKPFTINEDLCALIPNKCLYKDDGKEPKEINDARRRILVANGIFVTNEKRKHHRKIIHIGRSLKDLKEILRKSC